MPLCILLQILHDLCFLNNLSGQQTASANVESKDMSRMSWPSMKGGTPMNLLGSLTTAATLVIVFIHWIGFTHAAQDIGELATMGILALLTGYPYARHQKASNYKEGK